MAMAREKTCNHLEADRISFCLGTAEDLPVDDNISDYVFAFDSIDHWNDIDKGVSEIRRILKNGGILVIVKDLSVPDANEHLSNLRRVLSLSGFDIHEDREMATGKVRFIRIICGKNDNKIE
jgi:ubiquinone/menaquinone biosynthesis C-methylase UbiE